MTALEMIASGVFDEKLRSVRALVAEVSQEQEDNLKLLAKVDEKFSATSLKLDEVIRVLSAIEKLRDK